MYTYINKSMTITQLKDELGYKRIKDLTLELEKRGVVKHTSNGYRLTDQAIQQGLGKIDTKLKKYGGTVKFNLYFVAPLKEFLDKDRYLPIEKEKCQSIDIDEFHLDDNTEIDADLAYTLMEIEEGNDPSDDKQHEPTFIEGSRGSIHSGGQLYHSTIRSFRSNGF